MAMTTLGSQAAPEKVASVVGEVGRSLRRVLALPSHHILVSPLVDRQRTTLGKMGAAGSKPADAATAPNAAEAKSASAQPIQVSRCWKFGIWPRC